MKDITILFVDDEQNILNALERNLLKEPYKKRFAGSGKAALDIMAAEPVHVIVSDMKMPEMDGLTLLREVKEKYPETVRVVLSGFTQVAQIIPAINTGEIFRYVTKPLEPVEFRETLQEAVNFYLLNRDRKELVDKLQRQNEELQIAYAQTKKYAYDLTAEVEERKKVEADLELARKNEMKVESRIEENLLRGYPPITFQRARVSALTIPSEHLDGDFYEIIDYHPDCFDVLVGDVMGKGVHAALMGAGVKQFILKSLCRDRSPDSPAGLPSLLNLFSELQYEVIPRLIELEHFITLCYARVDLKKMQIQYVDCGHNPILHFIAADNQCLLLKGDNMPIGFSLEEIYKIHSADLGSGDVLFFFSDGITEAANPEGDMFGETRLVDFVTSHNNLEPNALIDSLRKSVEEFSGSSKFKDDFTCVSVLIDRQPVNSIELTSDLGELDRAREFTRDFCRQLPAESLNQDKISMLELAVNEVVVNIIEHSYQNKPGKKIIISAQVNAAMIVFEVFDWAEKFKPENIDLPDAEQERGRGLFLIHECVDRVSYSHENGRNCCRLEIDIGGQ